MNKELDKMSDETKYELNVYCRQLSKDLTNLMDCLRKQDKDNKAILYEGRHLKKVVLPYEEYQKMCQRLEAIDNAKPSEALNITKATEKYTGIDLSIVKHALQRLNKYEQILSSGRLTDRNYKNTTLDLDSCKPYLRLGQLEDIYEEGK